MTDDFQAWLKTQYDHYKHNYNVMRIHDHGIKEYWEGCYRTIKMIYEKLYQELIE